MDKELFKKALEMPPNQRLAFAELILASIDHEDPFGQYPALLRRR